MRRATAKGYENQALVTVRVLSDITATDGDAVYSYRGGQVYMVPPHLLAQMEGECRPSGLSPIAPEVKSKPRKKRA